MNAERKIKIIKLVIAICMITLISVVLKTSNKVSISDTINVIRDSGKIGVLVYITLFTLLPTFFMPVTILAIGAGAVFGFLSASLYTFIGAFLNSSITYFISKYFAYDLINDYLKNKYEKEYVKLKNNTKGRDGMVLMIVLRLLPLIPYTLLNYLSGIAGYDYKTFIISTLLGIIPGMLCYVNIGANSINGLSTELILSISILIAFLVLTSLLAKKYYYKKND